MATKTTRLDPYKKWIEDNNRRDAERKHENKIENFRESNKAAIASGTLALRTALVVNGGAVLAVLALVGNALSKVDITLVKQMLQVTNSLTWFVAGIVSALVAMASSYLNHYSHAGFYNSHTSIWKHPYLEIGHTTNNWKWAVRLTQFATVLLTVLSVGLFVFGVMAVRDAIRAATPCAHLLVQVQATGWNFCY